MFILQAVASKLRVKSVGSQCLCRLCFDGHPPSQVLAQQPEDVLTAFAGRIHERVAELNASEAVETQVSTTPLRLPTLHTVPPCQPLRSTAQIAVLLIRQS